MEGVRKIVNQFKTKYEQGFIDSEVNEDVPRYK